MDISHNTYPIYETNNILCHLTHPNQNFINFYLLAMQQTLHQHDSHHIHEIHARFIVHGCIAKEVLTFIKFDFHMYQIQILIYHLINCSKKSNLLKISIFSALLRIL